MNTYYADNDHSYSPTNTAFGLKWHKFLIYFALWIGGIGSMISGGMFFMSGCEMGASSSSAALLALYGVISFACGFCMLVLRFSLANFRQGAYKKLFAVQLIANVAGLLLGVVAFSAFLSAMAGCIVTFLYYKKRDELFVN